MYISHVKERYFFSYQMKFLEEFSHMWHFSTPISQFLVLMLNFYFFFRNYNLLKFNFLTPPKMWTERTSNFENVCVGGGTLSSKN